jgi:hypothetical protein
MGAQPWGRLCLQRMKCDQINRPLQRSLNGRLQSRKVKKRSAIRWFDEQVEITPSPLLIARVGAEDACAPDAMLAEDADEDRTLILGEAAYTRIWNGRPPQVVSAPNI